jgi:hypothetical protein
MRFPLAQLVIVGTVYLFAGNAQIQGQAAPAVEAEKSCPPSSVAYDKKPSDPGISVALVTFSGFLRMPVPDQDEVAASLKERTYATSLSQATDEALEITRAGWQNRGYFKVKANGYATTVDSGPANRRIALNVHVDEGLIQLGRDKVQA